MAWATGAAVLVLVGVPLLTWWVGGRRSWRERQPADAYVPLQMARRHELRPAERSVVERAATWGRELHDARLRAAVVELAEREVGPGGARRLPPLWLVLLYAAFGAALATGGPSDDDAAGCPGVGHAQRILRSRESTGDDHYDGW